MHLARLLRLDEITAVAVPTIDQEAARDLVRAREDCCGDLMRARHRLSKFQLRHGIVYDDGAAWTAKHQQWLVQQRLSEPAARAAFDAELGTVLQIKARRHRLDRATEEFAGNSEFAPVVRRLGCLRGVSVLTGFASRSRDRGLGPLHRQQHRFLRRAGPQRILLRRFTVAGTDHENRQRTRPPTTRRSGLAPPRSPPRRRCDARSLGARFRGGQSSRRSWEPTPA